MGARSITPHEMSVNGQSDALRSGAIRQLLFRQKKISDGKGHHEQPQHGHGDSRCHHTDRGDDVSENIDGKEEKIRRRSIR
jgi:hypothetical protein